MLKESIYDKINPELYEKRQQDDSREKYLYDHWYPAIESLIKRYSKNSIVLDMGCGSGNYSFEIKKYAKQVIGIDSSKRMINYAKNKYQGIDFIYANALNIPFENNYFDVVFSSGLFEYVDKDKLTSEMSRVLKSGGVGIIWVPNKYSLLRIFIKIFYKISRKKYIPNEPTLREMLSLFKINDFSVIEYKMDDGLIWLPNFLEKLIGKKVYNFIEGIFRIFRRNPFSTDMLFLIKKNN